MAAIAAVQGAPQIWGTALPNTKINVWAVNFHNRFTKPLPATIGAKLLDLLTRIAMLIPAIFVYPFLVIQDLINTGPHNGIPLQVPPQNQQQIPPVNAPPQIAPGIAPNSIAGVHNIVDTVIGNLSASPFFLSVEMNGNTLAPILIENPQTSLNEINQIKTLLTRNYTAGKRCTLKLYYVSQPTALYEAGYFEYSGDLYGIFKQSTGYHKTVNVQDLDNNILNPLRSSDFFDFTISLPAAWGLTLTIAKNRQAARAAQQAANAPAPGPAVVPAPAIIQAPAPAVAAPGPIVVVPPADEA